MTDILTTVDEVIDGLGGTKATAEVFDCRPQVISNWRKRGRFPYRAHMRIWSLAQERGLDIAPELVGLDTPTPQEARDA